MKVYNYNVPFCHKGPFLMKKKFVSIGTKLVQLLLHGKKNCHNNFVFCTAKLVFL